MPPSNYIQSMSVSTKGKGWGSFLKCEEAKNLNPWSFWSSESVGELMRKGQEAGRTQKLTIFYLLSLSSPGSQEF